MNVASVYAPRRDHPKFTDYRPLLELQRRTVERFGHRQVVVTDPAGAAELGAFECIVVDLPPALMPALMAGAAAFIRDATADTLLTAADCLLAADPSIVFRDRGFDLAVTTEAFPDCILNTGALFVPAGAAARAVPFFDHAATHCGPLWGDDQLSLAAVLSPTLDHGDRLRGHPGGGPHVARVRFLPCRGFNQAPDRVDHDIRPVVAHFRGPRKAWMAEWAHRHLGF